MNFYNYMIRNYKTSDSPAGDVRSGFRNGERPSPAGIVIIFTMWQMKRQIPITSTCSPANSAIVHRYALSM